MLWSGEMYIVSVYDVNETKCAKVMKIMRKYLFHVQNSVFEGELNPNKLNELKKELSTVIDSDDHIVFYYVYNNKQMYKDYLGRKENSLNIKI